MVEFGVSSSIAPLREVLVQTPGPAFAAAFEDSRHGFRHPVAFGVAQKEHQALIDLLGELDVNVHVLANDDLGPDFVYQYDPTLVTRRGAILLRSGKPTRRGEEDALAAWYRHNEIPIIASIEAPGTVDGGDVCWLDGENVCVGRTLRTNQAGIDQLSALLVETVHVFDMPYDKGPDDCLHLMSVISPVSETLALVELARLPAGLYSLCGELGIGLIDVPPEEVDTLACNVLAVRPGVVMMLDGNPVTRQRLEDAGVEVHTFEGREICLNGNGGPTCLTRPLLRT
ncbi:MAG: arginine deiminase family protein [Actinobacteria bacterium]|nr:arginine deiminase family protein [Actinomycetota bacterium]